MIILTIIRWTYDPLQNTENLGTKTPKSDWLKCDGDGQITARPSQREHPLAAPGWVISWGS